VPRSKDTFVLGSLTCHKIYTGGLKWNEHGVWFPHAELVAAVEAHDPDLLYFSGDQIYESDLTPAQRNPPETGLLDYLAKWYRWCWAFRDLMRDRPTIVIPDDHDVYHGNLAQDAGGYKMPPEFVNAVHRTQTSHLPDPIDPEPIEQDISVYFTRLEYAGMSFAILADRQFKSSATVMVPAGEVKNGWFQNPDFDPVTGADVPGAVLLGERQLAFLNRWATDWSEGAFMKVALSQTIFSNLATIPGEAKSGSVLPGLAKLEPGAMPEGYQLAADTDSGGWPQTGRNRALAALRRGFAMHVAGDQHLGAALQYGIYDFGDAGFAFSTPAIANTWPRRWYPPTPGRDRAPGAPPYTGGFRDGFGNFMTVYAVANPVISGREPARLYDAAPGYGILRFDRRTRDVTIECWPRWVDPTDADARQFDGWPITFNQVANDGRAADGMLPTIEVVGLEDPVIQVIDERTGEIISALRIAGRTHQPRAIGRGPFTVRVGDPDRDTWQRKTGLRGGTGRAPVITMTFDP
jgi:hypothetical protein